MLPHSRSRPALLLLAAAGGAVLLLGAGGCATVAAPPSALMQRVGKSDLRPEELRIRVRALAPRFSGQLENLADDVSRQAGDAPTRLAMARFKTNAIPALQSALFQPDPVAALVDTWALVAQLQDVLVRTQAEAPARAALATPRFAAMEQELAALWAELTGNADTAKPKATVHAWAAQHPIEGSVAARPTTTALIAQLDTQEGGVKARAAVGRLLEGTQDVVARLDLQTAFLPKQARWQAETFVFDALQDPAYRDALPELPQLMAAVQALTQQVEALPWLVARERQAVLAGVREERLGAQGFVTGEREALVGTLREERAAVMAQMDQMVMRTTDHAFDRAQRLVDRMFLWFAGLLLLGVLGGALVALLVVRSWRAHHGPPLRPRREAHA